MFLYKHMLKILQERSKRMSEKNGIIKKLLKIRTQVLNQLKEDDTQNNQKKKIRKLLKEKVKFVEVKIMFF